jgi:hypothetical protein
MFVALILTLALSYGLARVMVGQRLKEIQANWAAYRCGPEVMIAAGLFKPAVDPRSEFDFAYDNFSFCTSELAKEVLTNALKPVMAVFYQMTNSAIQSIGFTMSLRTLASNLYNGLNRIFDVFTRRFNLTIHELHKTFELQLAAISKANAIATGTVYAGISVIRTIMNLFKLMMIVSIAILVILVVLVIFLFFVLAPVIPVIMVAISVLSATAMAGSVGGMGNAFCFAGETRILMYDGGLKRIDAIELGDVLENGSRVTACMTFATSEAAEFYNIDGIRVSGSHLIYINGRPTAVERLPTAKRIAAPAQVYCLNTSSHRIVVDGEKGDWTFADWEELDDDAQADWEALVSKTLNGVIARPSASASWILETEAGLDPDVKIEIADGRSIPIAHIRPGDHVKDGAIFTRVLGTVLLEGDGAVICGRLQCSGACWVEEGGRWIRAAAGRQWNPLESPASTMRMLITESGRFSVNGVSFRDFTDVGIENINKTYEFAIEHMTRKISINRY